MNQFLLQTKTYFCALVILFSSVNAAENQSVEVIPNIKNNNSVVWYKKRSMRIAAATAVTAVLVLYALAVHKNKVVGPVALLAALYGAEKNIEQPKPIDVVKPEIKSFEKTGESEEQNKVQTPEVSHVDSLQRQEKPEDSGTNSQALTVKTKANDEALSTEEKQVETNVITQKMNELGQFWRNIQITASNVDQSHQEQANL